MIKVTFHTDKGETISKYFPSPLHYEEWIKMEKATGFCDLVQRYGAVSNVTVKEV